jgi:hypothetical protein
METPMELNQKHHFRNSWSCVGTKEIKLNQSDGIEMGDKDFPRHAWLSEIPDQRNYRTSKPVCVLGFSHVGPYLFLIA